MLAALDEIAAARGATVTAISLAWLRQQPTVTAPIASVRNTSQLKALIESTRLELTHEEIVALNTASVA